MIGYFFRGDKAYKMLTATDLEDVDWEYLRTIKMPRKLKKKKKKEAHPKLTYIGVK